MYDVALSVAACLRAGTRVDVAWVVATEGLPPTDPSSGMALTPGGGRLGSLLGGVVDQELSALAQVSSTGRIVVIDVPEVVALATGQASGGRVHCALAPADALPEGLWDLLLAREAVCLVSDLAGDAIVATRLHTASDIEGAGEESVRRFRSGRSSSERSGDSLVTVLHPVPRLIVAGGGPIAESLEAAARPLGWQVVVASETATAIGLMVGLSSIDAAIVMGHDVESSSRVLAAALEGGAGYIGSVGSMRMQEDRADWLAYRGVTDLSRVHGPAGLAIGARGPAESAIAILAEAIATLTGAS